MNQVTRLLGAVVLGRLPVVLLCVLVVGTALVTIRPVAAQEPYVLDVAPPDLVGGPWLNTPKAEPIKLASRIGKVTILHFWTFG